MCHQGPQALTQRSSRLGQPHGCAAFTQLLCSTCNLFISSCLGSLRLQVSQSQPYNRILRTRVVTRPSYFIGSFLVHLFYSFSAAGPDKNIASVFDLDSRTISSQMTNDTKLQAVSLCYSESLSKFSITEHKKFL
jgi:hypothetical protein